MIPMFKEETLALSVKPDDQQEKEEEPDFVSGP